MKRILSLLLCISLLTGVGVYAAHAQDKQPERYEERFLEKYPKQSYYEDYEDCYGYQELGDYYSVMTDPFDPDAQPDWVVVQAYSGAPVLWSTYCIIGDRVFFGEGDVPFAHKYGVYDVRRDTFLSIENAWLSGAYPELNERIEELRLGYPIGDADMDGDLTILDATRIQRILADLDQPMRQDELDRYALDVRGGFAEEQDELKFISDYDRDGERTIVDATGVQRKLADLTKNAPRYPKTENLTVGERFYSGQAVDSELLETRDNALQNPKNSEAETAVIQNALELEDFLGQPLETYDDSFFADNALFAARVRLSRGYEEAFRLLDLTAEGEYLYPHFAATGFKSYVGQDIPYTDRLCLYRIDKAVARQFKAIVPSAEMTAKYSIYSVDIETDPIRLPREKVELKQLENGTLTGDFVQQKSSTKRFNFAVLSSPVEVYDFMGARYDRYDEAYFSDKKLLAVVYRDSAGESTVTVRDIYGDIDESWTSVYHWGVKKLTFRIDQNAPLPEDYVWKYTFYEYSDEMAQKLQGFNVVDSAAGTCENVYAEYDDYFNRYYNMNYPVTVITRKSAESSGQHFYMPDDGTPYIAVFDSYDMYRNSPVASGADDPYDESFFNDNSLLFICKTYTANKTLTASDVQAGADVAHAMTTPTKVAELYVLIDAVKDDDPAKNKTADYDFFITIPKLPSGKYYRTATITEPPYRKII